MMLLAAAGGVRLKWDMVREVIDGDTFVLGNGQKIRMLGIDAPNREYCGGEEARKLLINLIMGKRVKPQNLQVDPFKRILALVYIDNNLINEKMLESGWVKWDGTENGLGSRFKTAGLAAETGKKGVYGICREPGKTGCRIKGNIAKANGTTQTGGAKWYFFPGCSEYEAVIVEKERGEEWFCTEKEAQAAGYKKGTNCFGKGFNPSP